MPTITLTLSVPKIRSPIRNRYGHAGCHTRRGRAFRSVPLYHGAVRREPETRWRQAMEASISRQTLGGAVPLVAEQFHQRLQIGEEQLPLDVSRSRRNQVVVVAEIPGCARRVEILIQVASLFRHG